MTHASFRIGDTILMASNGGCSGFQGINLSLNLGDAAEAEPLFAALADEGEVQMSLGATSGPPAFGMVVDCFRVS